MVFVLRYSLRASLPRSFPKPERLNPPKGAATSVLLQLKMIIIIQSHLKLIFQNPEKGQTITYILTKHVPASRCSLTQRALLRSLVNTPLARPYSVLLARFTTPSTSPAKNLDTTIIGPKLSSLAMYMSSSTSQKMVGSIKSPGLIFMLASVYSYCY